MNAWGKMPHLPLELVPDQHQCSGYGPEEHVSIPVVLVADATSPARKQLTAYVGNNVILVKLEPIRLVLAAILVRELPLRLGAHIARPAQLDFSDRRWFQLDRVRRYRRIYAIMPPESPFAHVLGRPGKSRYVSPGDHFKSWRLVAEEPLPIHSPSGLARVCSRQR